MSAQNFIPTHSLNWDGDSVPVMIDPEPFTDLSRKVFILAFPSEDFGNETGIYRFDIPADSAADYLTDI